MIILRAIVAFVLGTVIGGAVNMTLVVVGPMLIPPPEGVDVTKVESLAASVHLLSARHFVFPFLAHALGTPVGALAGFLIAGQYKHVVAYALGALNLCGGIAASFMIPAPTAFIVIDLVLAYVPMAWIAVKLGQAIQPKQGRQPTASAG
jgi:hypothetical protein